MKGGNLVILFALKALDDVGALENIRIIVALTGDEENPGKPVEISRQDLLEAGRRSDIALGFEAGVRDIHTATIARRGASGWTLRVTARPAHSSQIFDDSHGAGAIFEASRILNAFYSQIRGEQYLTFNPGVILGGTAIDYDPQANRGSAFGKTNVIAETAVVHGDLRFLSVEQKERAREQMRAIVALSLPGAEAEITFRDGYPAMFPSQGNYDLLTQFESVNRDLGFGELEILDPSQRGAADISFVAAAVEGGLAGLGPVGWKGHTVDEHIDLSTLSVAAKRVAVLIYRLTR
jgi:glutamate carboxypeptidase